MDAQVVGAVGGLGGADQRVGEAQVRWRLQAVEFELEFILVRPVHDPVLEFAAHLAHLQRVVDVRIHVVDVEARRLPDVIVPVVRNGE
ncbi:MAG TPA: hypothetical protein P5572_15915, partial [Phycisphaerae bacterium]|nr:hypothetical protein [Phycisphaerae bacterium]